MSTDPSTPRWRVEVRAFAELFALCGLAIAQPLLDVFGRSPQHFIFRGSDRGDIIGFGLAVTFVAPVLLALVGLVLGFVSPRLRTVYHSIVLWGLAAIVLTFAANSVLPRIAALLFGALAAGGLIALYHRTRGVRIWLAFLSPAPIVFLALFLLASPISPLLRNPGGSLGTVVNRPTRTVVILFDEFSLPTLLDENGDVDADLFPNFARLAETSHWFRQTTTTTNLTARAVPSVLTGNPPVEGSTATSSFFPENLFTLVGGAMPITSSEVVSTMCPSSVCEQIDVVKEGLGTLLHDARGVLRNRLDPRDPDVDVMSRVVEARAAERSGDPVDDRDRIADEERNPEDGGIDRFNLFLDSIGDDDGLHFIHLLLPHTPYRLLPDGTVYPSEHFQVGRLFDSWSADPTTVHVGMQRYLLQLQWVDVLIGRTIDDLQEKGLWDDTNFVVTADHGFAFEPGGPFRALTEEDAGNDTAIAQVLWVPFFVKTAGQTEAVVSDDPVRNLDTTPTIADLLDVAIPWEHEGRSAFDGGSGDPDEVGMYLGNSTGGEHGTGPYRTLPRDLGHELMLSTTAATLAPPGDGVHGTDRIHRAGPRPDLWSEPVPDGLRRIDVTPEDFSRADDVDPDSGTIPAKFVAYAEDVDPGATVAISVDGTIWATTWIIDFDGRSRIDAMLPREAFRAGANDIRVYVLDEPAR